MQVLRNGRVINWQRFLGTIIGGLSPRRIRGGLSPPIIVPVFATLSPIEIELPFLIQESQRSYN